MLSLRLWRTIAEAEIHDPIFRRVSRIQTPTVPSKPSWRGPRLARWAAVVAASLALCLAPQMLALVLIVPILMMSLVVAAPLYLPAVVWLAGALATGELMSGIYREKRQHTYDLICASTQGKLNASWSFASGRLHRGASFQSLRWGTRMSLRLGLAALAGLTALVLLFALAGDYAFGARQVRLLLLPLLLLAVYFTNLAQTFVTSHLIGLLFSNCGWAQRDATLVGVLAYLLLSSLPLLGAGLAYLSFRWLVIEPGALTLLAAESLALLLVIGGREGVIVGLWAALRRRLDGGRLTRGLAPSPIRTTMNQGDDAVLEARAKA